MPIQHAYQKASPVEIGCAIFVAAFALGAGYCLYRGAEALNSIQTLTRAVETAEPSYSLEIALGR